MTARNSIFWNGKEYLYSAEDGIIMLLHEGDSEFTYAKYKTNSLDLLKATTCIDGSCFSRDKECLGDDFPEVAGIVEIIL